MSSVITEDELPDDVTSAESFLTRHQEHKAEIDTRQRSVNDFYEAADKLIADGHSASADVKDKKQRLSKAWQALQTTWSEKGVDLEQSKEVQVFKRDADQLEAWLNARDLDQESGDVGDSLDAVEELLKKHDEFEKMLLAQEMKLLGIVKLTQQEEGVNKQKEDEDEMREEQERRKKIEEEERQEKKEQELRERKRLEQIRLGEENDRKERRRREEEQEKQEQERRERKRSEQSRLREESDREERRRREEEEQQKKAEQELRERKRLEQIRVREENDRREKERKQQEEREKVRALEEKKRAEAKAKQEEQKKRLEAERQLRLEEQRKRDEQNNNNNNNKSDSSAQDQQKASVPSTVEGILQRKQALEPGGRKAHARAWKTLYTVLRGHQLFFYREKKDAQTTNYAASPVDLTDGFCEEASDVARRKNAFRLSCDDDSDFFFVAKDPQDLKRWVKNISEAAGQAELPSPPPPPQTTRLPSPKTSPRTERQENGGSPKVTTPYGRTSKPLITVTSFDDDEDLLIDPPPPPPVNIPPPAVPSGFGSGVPTESDHENDILADIGNFPLEPDSLPPAVPPPDFADFDDSSEGEDLPVLPASPPPEFLSDDEDGIDNGVEDSPLANIISQLQQPSPPPRSKRKAAPPPVAPKPEGRIRSDSRDSTDSGGKPKPPVKPKPVNLTGQRSANSKQAQGVVGSLRSAVDNGESAQDDKKRKGVLGNIFKKKK